MFLGVASYLKFTAAFHALRVNRSSETQLKQHQGAVDIFWGLNFSCLIESIFQRGKQSSFFFPDGSGRQVSVPCWSVQNYTGTLKFFFNSWSPWRHVMLLSNKSDVNLGSWVIFPGRVRPKNVLLPKPPSWRENRSKNNPTCTKVDPKTLHRRWTLLVMYSWTKGGIDSGSGDCFVMYILAFSMYYMELLHDCLDYKKFTL